METEVHYSLFGEVLKTFGTNGELLVKISANVPKSEKIKEPVFVKFDGLWVPFYFKLFEPRGQKAKIIFENIDSESLAEELVGKKIFTPNNDKNSKPVEGVKEFIGFKVEDTKYGVLGTVSEIYEFPGNPCIEMDSSKGKILIPLNSALKIDYRKKIIKTEIPEGLLEL